MSSRCVNAQKLTTPRVCAEGEKVHNEEPGLENYDSDECVTPKNAVVEGDLAI